MSDDDVNRDIKEWNINVKNSDESAEVVKEMEKKSLKVKNAVSYCLPTTRQNIWKI